MVGEKTVRVTEVSPGEWQKISGFHRMGRRIEVPEASADARKAGEAERLEMRRKRGRRKGEKGGKERRKKRRKRPGSRPVGGESDV